MTKRPTLDRIEKNLKTIPWYEIGQDVLVSVQKNFDSGGRPKKWPKRKKQYTHPILNKTGAMKNNHYIYEIPNGVIIGNRTSYAPVHHYGAPRKNIPGRRFLLVQNEDKPEIISKIKKHILK